MRLGFLDFFRDIANFVKSGSVLGIDIGTVSVKIAEVGKRGERFRLLNYGVLETKRYFERPNEAIQTSSLKLSEAAATELVKTLLRETGTKTRTAVCSIPAFSAFVAPLEMPFLSPAETARTVGFEARQYIPLPVSEVSIDWLKVDEFDSPQGGRSQRLLLIGIPNETIRKYKNIFKNCGLRLVALELETFSLIRALGRFSSPTLVVDIGAESTAIAVAEAGVLKHVSQTDYGGIHLTAALSKSLGVSVKRAEELKRRRGLLATGGESELSTLIVPFLDVIIQEVRYAQDSYERRWAKKVAGLTLVGGGSELLGIEKYLERQMGLPCTSPDVFGDVDYDASAEPLRRNLSRVLPVAVGLAKKYFQN
ncbi:MAG: Type IV pilus assembly protein PilM [Candidatus Jorgensenbacteria bacterium GW2011_GWA1_48_13]|uniref:Type IV pilus assembly protein PilM n=1 Tax=Candidatus Jorgensenbacteria bacterium GW2011_GWB1_50_10 TaxID=1618665 RepID=A0A0G1W9B4_9BACT|nr:MAG: Type IV pilus assembly protein PilM [Candidatus Jorgensenbacteria bacterium GW2011_GWA1_48_13]KKW15363.1 MAG: Type IV pilus assembly protein PilM [Candidatus Jorgensenbacteria bacterium GW2011_GWB1_50_10]